MKKHKISVIQLLRHLFQLLFFIFLPGLFISTFNGIKEIYLATINNSFSFTQLAPQLIEVISLIPVTIVMGRFFCGWMCSLGTLGDLIYGISSKIFRRKTKINKELDEVLKYAKYMILVLLISVIWSFNITIFKSWNPWDVFGMMASLNKVPDLSYILANLTGGLVLFTFIVIGSALVERFFCRYLCPLGAVFALTSKLRIAKIHKPSQKCGSCRICTMICAMGIPLYKADDVCSGECIQCMKCITKCPRKNITITVSEKDIKPMVVGATAVSVMTGFYYVGNISANGLGASDTNSSKQSTIISESQQGNSNKSAVYKDGTYEGTGTGFRGGETSVSVVIKNDKITDIKTISYEDDKPYYNKAFTTVSKEIINSQLTEVDSVSGATFSSRGIMAAVQDALVSAKSLSNSKESAVNNETQGKKSEDKAPAKSIETPAQSTLGSPSKESSSKSFTYKDGTYEGTGTGFRGRRTTVSVVIKDGKITDIKTVSYGDDRPYYNRAFNSISGEIINGQSTDVDSVSGATFSSRGIMAAVVDALSKSKK